jgi:hypothetical protein
MEAVSNLAEAMEKSLSETSKSIGIEMDEGLIIPPALDNPKSSFQVKPPSMKSMKTRKPSRS